LTHVKIEAHGHLGDYSRDFFIEEGKELENLQNIFKDFVLYVLDGKKELIMKVLGELAAIEALEKRSP